MSAEILIFAILSAYAVFGIWLLYSVHKKSKRKRPKLRIVRNDDNG